MVALHTPEHNTSSNHMKLVHSSDPLFGLFGLSQRVKQFLIEDRDVLHAGMLAVIAHVVVVQFPMQHTARATLAEVVGEGTDFEEAEEGEELADAVLNWCARETPFVCASQREAGFGNAGLARLDTVRLVKDQAVKVDGMNWRCFFDDVLAAAW